MTPIPEEFDPRPLVGSTLAQVCIDPYAFQFHFDPAGSISGSGRVTVEADDEPVTVFADEAWIDPRPLTKLVGQGVTTSAIEDRYAFSVGFADGTKVHFRSKDSRQEDFVVHLQSDVWVM